jgi:hypothetical protein
MLVPQWLLLMTITGVLFVVSKFLDQLHLPTPFVHTYEATGTSNRIIFDFNKHQFIVFVMLRVRNSLLIELSKSLATAITTIKNKC